MAYFIIGSYINTINNWVKIGTPGPADPPRGSGIGRNSQPGGGGQPPGSFTGGPIQDQSAKGKKKAISIASDSGSDYNSDEDKVIELKRAREAEEFKKVINSERNFGTSPIVRNLKEGWNVDLGPEFEAQPALKAHILEELGELGY